MNPSATFRPATRDDCYTIAELFGIASGGVAEYIWSTLARFDERRELGGCY